MLHGLKDGKVFTAPTIIGNADPQNMARDIGLEKFLRPNHTTTTPASYATATSGPGAKS